METQLELFRLPDPDHCQYEEWTYTQGRLSWPQWRDGSECGRGFNGKAVCRVCPYGEGA